jgi:FMN phosphatase YigB (HAD superfamily)
VRIASLIDVDNTLLDNDAAKRDLAQGLVDSLGEAGADRFWTVYEEVRAELGVVDIPRTIGRTLGREAPLPDRERLAALFMEFPFREYIYPDALETISWLKERGPVVILSDGDPVFQIAKIVRSGLADAADGNVLVFTHKEEHLLEIGAAFPAERYLLIDDKPGVIERMTARAHELPGPLETILVRQGKYAAAIGDDPAPWPGATYTVDRLGEVRERVGG